MGSGRWDTDVYTAAANYRATHGIGAFDYSDRARRGPRHLWRAHPQLDPFGLTVRESRDSAEHPDSQAVAVLFDVTGSMGTVPRVLQTKLPELFGLLLRKGYVRDPQILFGAIGDATCDRVPLQLGQFESDNRMDDNLGQIFLEGGGGGQMHESYELAMYAMARHTAIDCHEKRGRRGYLFVIGDELPYGRVSAAQVHEVFGERLPEDIPVEVLLQELTRRWDVYFVLPAGSSYVGNDQVLGRWRTLLGDNVVELDDLDAVCETIALTIGLGEGAIDLDEGLADLADIGSRAGVAVRRALSGVARRSGEVAVSGVSLLKHEGAAHDGPDVRGNSRGNTRL
ncbi:hypothetical protein [Streptacidiphilus jiangxiensis]|uniref:VWFA domain-containing protein n=1 Tax=Streptacidiphilus jiangxiensis TaxID=235985 RepID=A0A1H7UG37_STRJI|nr:hypothetical protein [Streptacidiphilus jiangxiensis]SEL95207.1 hypothetical protein SAMN05414137_115237 [Streptacidiphilus jiangxiensis]